MFRNKETDALSLGRTAISAEILNCIPCPLLYQIPVVNCKVSAIGTQYIVHINTALLPMLPLL